MNRLKELREVENKTTLEVSIAIGVTQRTIQKYEKGTLDMSTEILNKFAELYDCSTDYILKRSHAGKLPLDYYEVCQRAADKKVSVKALMKFIEAVTGE